ncbi:hypothetical protein B0H63DRAFT_529814 [Podospora didyma]|uniref:Mid2 domain-containing protein n=1 Tax=Podospora didyma TaxID=330526 RepID=A0AAE0N0J8_9PEZI|nr:hypothetical protein B0H63DRAFT_529814 [Podospora didyma]
MPILEEITQTTPQSAAKPTDTLVIDVGKPGTDVGPPVILPSPPVRVASTASPSAATTRDSTDGMSDGGEASTGVKAGIALAVLGAVLLALLAMWICAECRKRRLATTTRVWRGDEKALSHIYTAAFEMPASSAGQQAQGETPSVSPITTATNPAGSLAPVSPLTNDR